MKCLIIAAVLVLAATDLLAYKVGEKKLVDKEKYNDKSLLNQHSKHQKFYSGYPEIKKPGHGIQATKNQLKLKNNKNERAEHAKMPELKKLQGIPASKLRASKPDHRVIMKHKHRHPITKTPQKIYGFKLDDKHKNVNLNKAPSKFHKDKLSKKPISKLDRKNVHTSPKKGIKKSGTMDLFHHKKSDDSHKKLKMLQEKLKPNEFKQGFNNFNKVGQNTKRGHALIDAGLDKINTKHLDKPFFGVYGEYDELDDTMDYLKHSEDELNNMEIFPVKDHLDTESATMLRGNYMMNSGFDQMEKLHVSPKYNDLHLEFKRLGNSRSKLDDSEQHLNNLDFSDSYEKLEGEGIQFDDGNKIFNDQFENLHDSDLYDQYGELGDKFNNLERGQSEITSFGRPMKNINFNHGFEYMKEPMENINNGNMFWKNNDIFGFSGSQKKPSSSWTMNGF